MKLTSSLVLKVVLALAPAIVGSVVTYWLSKDKAAGGYTTLADSVNQLQGGVEQLRLQVQHLQDLHYAEHPVSKETPALRSYEKELNALLGVRDGKAPRAKAFKRVPMKLDDARQKR